MLSFPFFKKKEEKPVYFGVSVNDVSTSGFIFDLEQHQARISSQSSYDVPPVYDQVLQALDTVISDIESSEKVTISKTIFFLYSSQLDGQTHEIKEPYKSILKKSSAELALEALGYIDIHDAIAGSLKSQSVVNYLLIEVDQHTVTAFVYKGSQLTYTLSMTRTSSIAGDLESLFAQLPQHTLLPTNLYLYGCADMPHISSEITTHEWSESLFVQHPVITVLKDVAIMQTLADTCAEEILSVHIEKGQPPASQKVQAAPQTAGQAPSLGFLVGRDVALETPQEPSVPIFSPAPPPVALSPQFSMPASRPVGVTSNIDHIINTIKRDMSYLRLPSFAMGGSKWVIIIPVLLLLLVAAAGACEYQFHTAVIEVQVESKTLQKEIDADISVSDDQVAEKLSAILHTKSSPLTGSLDTSGKRDIGEKAKGQVTVHNFDNAQKSFAKGTKIKSGSYQFTLDTEVSVASSSSVTSDGVKQSGKAKVSVTADGIGPEYNLKNGVQLEIDGMQTSLFVAFADGAFTGGTKKQITTVSKNDLDSLQANVEESAASGSATVLTSAVPADEVLITGLTEVALSETEFSKEVGEEASEVTLKATADVTFYTVKKSALIVLIASALTKEMPADFAIKPESIKYSFDGATLDAKTDQITVTIKAMATGLKKVNEAEVRSAAKMKSSSQLATHLKNISGVTNAVIISQKPQISFINWTPVFEKNITIRVDGE